MGVHLTPLPPADGAPGCVDWRVGPGLVRAEADVPPDTAPAPVRALFDADVLAAVRIEPGRIRTRFTDGHSAEQDGAAVRSALFAVLSQPGGWPAGPQDAAEVSAAADAEIAAAVRQVLADEFGAYTAVHGGRIDLVGVDDGVVTVSLGGACHGCSAAGRTLSENLALRLSRIPGYRTLRTAAAPTALPKPTFRPRRFRRSL
ncbi:NifU family protein [Gordonia sp. VNK21]|uniref:NifU family protein n=1 Tax=Gordonia sp. VNK21 TaxID=3382483 RepID=UPI0038D42FB6